MRGLLIAALFALSLSPLNAQPRLLRAGDNDTLPSKPATERAAYGPDSLQFGELRLPEGRGPFPVAIVIHGGCWISRFASLRNSTPLADALRDEGIATWNIEYRRVDHPGGGWPGTFTDAAEAVSFLRVLARRHPLDLSRVVTVGHSAGGHLALWLSQAPAVPMGSAIRWKDPLPLKGAIAIAGVADLAGFRGAEPNACARGVDGLIGGTVADFPDRYRAASPIHLYPSRVPQWQVVGSLDQIMPEGARNAQKAAAESSGTPFELIVIEGAGHHEPMSPRTEAGRAVIRAVRKALGLGM